MAWQFWRRPIQESADALSSAEGQEATSRQQRAAQEAFDQGLELQRAGDLESAARRFTDAMNDGHVEALNNLGLLAQNRGEEGLAREYFAQAAACGSGQGMHNLGVSAYLLEDLIGAKRWAEEAVAAGHQEANLILGEIALRRGLPDDAINAYSKLALHGHSGSMFKLGAILEDQGHLESARDWYGRAAAVGNPDAAARSSRVHRGY